MCANKSVRSATRARLRLLPPGNEERLPHAGNVSILYLYLLQLGECVFSDIIAPIYTDLGWESFLPCARHVNGDFTEILLQSDREICIVEVV